jgi:hypothetical protein
LWGQKYPAGHAYYAAGLRYKLIQDPRTIYKMAVILQNAV